MSAAFKIPRDEQGNPQPHNHPNFDGQRRVIRRVQNDHIVTAKDGVRRRISSAIFKNVRPTPLDYVSCDSEHCIFGKKIAPVAYVADDPKWIGAIVFTADDLRGAPRLDTAIFVGMWPLPDNDCHGAIWGKITSGQAKLLLSKCEWLREIEDVVITE